MAAKTFYQQSNSPSQNAAMTQIATTLQFEMRLKSSLAAPWKGRSQTIEG
jgi:hypothetical protein